MAAENPEIVKDLEGRLLAYAKEQKPSLWFKAQPAFISNHGKAVYRMLPPRSPQAHWIALKMRNFCPQPGSPRDGSRIRATAINWLLAKRGNHYVGRRHFGAGVELGQRVVREIWLQRRKSQSTH